MPSDFPGAGMRVLVVDDHDDTRELCRELLESAGHTVTCAADGSDGLRNLLAHPFDVAVIDIGLPGIDGCAIATQARASLGHSTPRLVAVSGYADAKARERGLTAGFDLYLVKPVDADDLLLALGKRR